MGSNGVVALRGQIRAILNLQIKQFNYKVRRYMLLKGHLRQVLQPLYSSSLHKRIITVMPNLFFE